MRELRVDAKPRILFNVALVLVLFPAIAAACECRAWNGPMEQYAAPFIFVGKVLGTETSGAALERVNENGRVWYRSILGTSTLRISIERQFRGTPVREIRITRPQGSFSDCDFTFVDGQSYLLFDKSGDGSSFNKCEPPIVVGEALEELKYIEGILANRPQSILYGYLSERKSPDVGTGQPPPSWPSVSVTVVANDGNGGVFRQKNKGNRYVLVVPPGQYRVWLEQDGKTLTEPATVAMENGKERAQDFDYELQK